MTGITIGYEFCGLISCVKTTKGGNLQHEIDQAITHVSYYFEKGHR